MTRLSLLLALLLGGAATTARASAANISNVLPRRDTSGAIMDMHDGNVHVGDDGTYYWYAAGYGVSTHLPPTSSQSFSPALSLRPERCHASPQLHSGLPGAERQHGLRGRLQRLRFLQQP